MKKTNTKPTEESFDLGYVVWEDANSLVDGRTAHDPHHAAMPLVSSGFIVKSDDTGVTVAMDFSCEGAFREIRFIPRANVKEVRVLQKDAVRRSPQYVVFPERKKGKR